MKVLAVAGGVIALVAVVVVGVLFAAGVSIFSANVNAIVAKRTLDPGVTVAVFNPQNKLQSQAYFENLKADFDGFLQQIKIVKASPDSQMNETNLQGLRLECVQTAQSYNAASRSIAVAPFRSADLPHDLDPARCAK